MKRIIALLCGAVLIGSLAACAVSGQVYDETSAPYYDAGVTLLPSEFSENDFDISGDIVLSMEYESYGSDAPEAFYVIRNNTTEEFMYGVDFAVEVLLEDKWYQVPFPENMAWIDIALSLKAGAVNSGSFVFSFLDYQFEDGTYRLIKSIGGKHYFAPFTIGESPITAETPFGYTALEKLPEEYSTEEAEKNGDVVITYDDIKNTDKLTAFVNKVSLGMSAMIRFVQYTIEGDPIISDFIYNQAQNCYLYRHDNSRDEFGTDSGIEETIYSYIITDGTDLYLSNCANWALTETYPNADLLQITWSADQGDLSDLVELAAKMTEERLSGNVTRYKVFSPNGEQAVSLPDGKIPYETHGQLFYGYEKPGFGDRRYVSDPDGIVTAIADVIWLDEQAYVLVCDTSSSQKYFQVVGNAALKSGYGTGYKIVDGAFEILL